MVDALISVAVEKLTHVLGQQLSLFASATSDLERLRNTLQSIKAVLADAESRQEADERMRLWLSRLRKVAYDIQDLLEEWLIAGLEKDASDDHEEEEDDDGSDGNLGNRVAACFLSPYAYFDQTVSRYKLARNMKETRDRLDEIAKDKEQLLSSSVGSSSQISSFGGDLTRPVRRSRTMTSSHMQEEMIGRNDDRDDLVSRLVSGSSSDDGQVQVLAIVGMGGQGKTTLARKIHNDSMVRDHFKLFMWVCVSEDFDVKRLTKAILEDAERKGTSLTELNSLQNALLEALKGNRFLLVLDDVWNQDKDKWNSLLPCLKVGAPGSKILVTTRLHKVAKDVMNAAYISELRGLSDDHSWMLFSSIAFDGNNAEDDSHLESIAREVVRKCKGVPLSIKVVASAMNSKRTRGDWQSMLESGIWSLPEAENKILPALWLSYNNLPSPLKQCFVYCSIYEKDTMMLKDELVNLWIAQGFIQLQGNREIEEVTGARYFDDLVAWSMLQEVAENYEGKITCKMHDLLHDLAGFITKYETHIYVTDRPNPWPTDVRHAALALSKNNSSIPIASHGAKTLRTLFLHQVDKIDTTLASVFRQARFLRALLLKKSEIKRLPETVWKLKHLTCLDLSVSWIAELPTVIGKMQQLKILNLSGSELVALPNAIGELKHLRRLDLSGTKLAELPNAIGKLKQLRYLDLSNSKIVELPESVSRLHNLHTLNLDSCGELKKLPRGIGEMVNLRHLKIESTRALDCLPEGLGGISCLQTMCNFIVGGEGGCGIDELQQLNSLEGYIRIKHLERVQSGEEARRSELWNKSFLHGLVLEFERDEEIMMSEEDAEIERMDAVLEGLKPPANLVELELHCNGRNSKLPSWMEDASLSKLTKLVIKGFIQHCEQNNNISGLGKLPLLEYLSISDVGVRKVGNEFCYGKNSSRKEVAFPKLKQLIFNNMSELEAWELTVEADAVVMPSLSSLKLEDCPKLERLLHGFTSTLTELIIRNCPRIEWTECCCFPLLEEFQLSGFFSSGLPDLPKLKKFEISKLRNEMLPNEGWEGLVALQNLSVENCDELLSLPDGLAKLQSLENLKVDDCKKLEGLFEGLGQLKKLRELELHGLEALISLPEFLGQLESLERLEINESIKLQSLPEGLGQLKKLTSITIRGAEALTRLPDSLGQLESLEDLHVSGLKRLELLPEGLGQLKKLSSLTIRDAEVLTRLPDSLGQLESLEDLHVGRLKRLELLPEGLGQLKKLRSLRIWDAEGLTRLPDSLGQLESLEDLEVRRLKRLELLPEGLGQLKKLRLLRIWNTEGLTRLPDSVALLESLHSLSIEGCPKLESLPQSLGQLKKLKSLRVLNMEALASLPDSLGQVESLRVLGISRCPKLKSLPPRGLRQLERLDLEVLAPLSNVWKHWQLESLKYLELRDLKELESLSPWLGQLKALRELWIYDCRALRSSLAKELRRLPLLQTLGISNCPLLVERCKREGGEDWYKKILDVPRIKVDGAWVLSL